MKQEDYLNMPIKDLIEMLHQQGLTLDALLLENLNGDRKLFM